MTIRKTLLITFLLVSLIPSILLTSLAFLTAGDSMRKEISQNLLVQSEAVSDEIDKMLLERLQNALTWRHLEVMQDIQVNDVDKRLSNFLSEIKNGYHDIYQEISCIDLSGRVIASSNASVIGQLLPEPDSLFQATDHVALEPLQLDLINNQSILTMRAEVPAHFKAGMAGELLLRFNWQHIYNILDQTAQGGRLAILIDRQNRIIAASKSLREQNMLLTKLPVDWLPTNSRSGVVNIDGQPLIQADVTVGYHHSIGFERFSEFGWTAMVIQPSSQIYFPVQHMALVFLALLAIVISFSAIISLLVATKISRPIADLTSFTRRFMQEKKLPQAPEMTGGEVGELTEAFVSTMTELEKSRANLVRASKLAVLGELSAVMAHEIRTPLGILRSSAQMLAREPELSDEAREMTDFIERETERLNRLVSTLLDSARPREPSFKSHDMNVLIMHCIDLLTAQAETKAIRIETKLDENVALIPCDDEQITQVLLNLMLNALQILPTGGCISIACRDDGDNMTIEVADNGPGIPPEDQLHVLDPFFTRREGGIGLGLAVVQQIIAAHNGEIHVSNSASGGALFTIILPHKEST